MNAQCPNKWWSTLLKSAVFGSSSDRLFLLLLRRVVIWSVSRSGRQICCRPILMESSPGIQSISQSDQTISHPSASLTTFAFRSREVKRLLLDLDSYGGTEPLRMFPLFLKKTAGVLAPLLAVVFRRLLPVGSFPVAGEWLISPQFQRVHLPPQHPIIDQFL